MEDYTVIRESEITLARQIIGYINYPVFLSTTFPLLLKRFTMLIEDTHAFNDRAPEDVGSSTLWAPTRM